MKRKGHVRTGLRRAARLARSGLTAAALILGVVLAMPVRSSAEGPNAIMTPARYNANAVARGDDTSNLVVGLPFTMNWGGTNYSQIYINMNGNCTFDGTFGTYTPSTALTSLRRDVMAPFWTDVDTRATGTGQLTYSDTANPPQVDGHRAFFVNWVNVGYYNAHTSPLNSFQLVLVDRSDTGAGNFDFYFNYDKVLWDTGDVSGNQNARVGWGRRNRTGFELPGSGSTGASTLLDSSSPSTSLIRNYMNDAGQLGRYVWQVRNGQPPNMPPVIAVTDRTLEGNAYSGYSGYSGTGDAAASDPDGSVVSFTRAPVAGTFLPLGSSTVTWTATDDRGAVTAVAQSIVVTDTTPPSGPTLSSSSHSPGAWSTDPNISVSWSGAADTCSGVGGYSYSWSQGAPALPDTVPEGAGSSVATFAPDGSWYFNVRTADNAGNWSPTAESIGPFRIDTTPPDTSDDAPAGWQAVPVGVTLTAADSGSGVAATRFRLNGSAAATYAGPVSASAEGTNTLQYWSVDAAGNVEATKTATVLIDTVAPAGSFAVSHGAAFTGTTTVTFDSTMTADAYQMRFDNGTGYDAWRPYSPSCMGTIAAGDGTKTVTAQFRDRAGNTATLADTIVLDTTAPHTTAVVTPPAPNGNDGWYKGSAPAVTLSSNKAGATWYSWNAASGPYSAYGATLTVPNGTPTLYFYSTDLAGNTEATQSAGFKADDAPPAVPTAFASTADSGSVDVTWTPVTDAVSGLAGYEVYQDGSLVATTTSTSYTASGLNAGQTYSFGIRSVDRAGNVSAESVPVTATAPSNWLWLDISPTTVDFGPVNPGTPAAISTATVVSVSGIGSFAYDLSCSATDFQNADPLSTTPTMPVTLMSFATRGRVARPQVAFSTSSQLIHSDNGVRYHWAHEYVFDFSLTIPWSNEAGKYTGTVTYTAVPR